MTRALTDDERDSIRRALRSGEDRATVARRHGVTATTVVRIANKAGLTLGPHDRRHLRREERPGMNVDMNEAREVARLYRELGSYGKVARHLGKGEKWVRLRVEVSGEMKGVHNGNKPLPMTAELRAKVVEGYKTIKNRKLLAKSLGIGKDRVDDVLAEELGII